MKKTFCIVMSVASLGSAINIAHDWHYGLDADWAVWFLAILGSLFAGMTWMEMAFPQLRGDD